MREKNIFLETLKVMGAIIAAWLLWVVVFASLPGESVEENVPFTGACFVFGLLTVIIVMIVIKYNYLTKLYQRIKSAKSNIQVHQEKEERLLDKANRVADKYMNFEERVQVGVSEMRGPNAHMSGKMSKKVMIQNASEFQAAVESYPELKANNGIMELLRQIKECEHMLMVQKMNYNDAVEDYNIVINSFPSNIIGKIFRFKEAEFYTQSDNNGEISDDELGI